ncbi:MAG: pilin [Plesiomonas shigelloides]|uniref:pilin n=1 Tax=Plesiomonas shigelloides TaxID=703 RepID=UPI00387F2205
MKAVNKGFTLIELMIVVAIVAILAAIALPAYQKYTARAKFSEVVTATNGVKQQVELCIFDKGALADCDSTVSGPGYNIRTATDYATKYIATITVLDGKITAAAKNTDGLGGYNFIIAPEIKTAGQIDWVFDTTSTCKANDLC